MRGGLSQVVRVLISLLISSHYVYYLRAWHRLRESLNGRENMARRKVKNGEKRAIFCRPFKLSLAPTICLWVSEDVIGQLFIYYFYPWLNGEKSQSSKPYVPLSTFFCGWLLLKCSAIGKPYNSENKPRGLCFSKALFERLIFGGGLYSEGLRGGKFAF